MEPPSIAYLSMAFLPMNLHHAVANCDDQIYPTYLKCLYLMYQRDRLNKFPAHRTMDYPFEIRQMNVEGIWPALWILKIEAYLKLAHEDIVLIWDEDDRYPPLYSVDIAMKFAAHPEKQVIWMYENRRVLNDSIAAFRHDCPMGASAFRVDFLHKVVAEILQAWPMRYSSKSKQGKRATPHNPQRLTGAVLDNKIRYHILEHYPDAVLDSVSRDYTLTIDGPDSTMQMDKASGTRLYVQHGEQNSRMKDAKKDLY